MKALSWLQEAWRAGRLEPVEVMLARQLHEMAGDGTEDGLWLAALLAYQYRQGHVCVDLKRWQGVPFGSPDCPWQVPSAEAATRITSRLLGTPETDAPLILDGPRLYLRRHWLAECRVARALRARCRPRAWPADLLARLVAGLFPEGADPWQRLAALNCAQHDFAVITGGPGTGKTWTVARMLALQTQLAEEVGAPPPRIALAAPTGKAAARLSQAVQAALADFPADSPVRRAVPVEALTLHRLLAIGSHGRPGHDADNPLPHRLVVIDEASMVDLGLMAQLVAALPEDASLYLVGDRDQLASVQAGSVFADVCGDADNHFDAEVVRGFAAAGVDGIPMRPRPSPVDSCVTRLVRTRRFSGDSGIGRLAHAVRGGDVQAVLAAGRDESLVRVTPEPEQVLEHMMARYVPMVSGAVERSPVEAVLGAVGGYRTLVAHRGGPSGVEALNEGVERGLRRHFGFGQDQWFPGRAVLLRHNDWNLRLFNGDLGVAVHDPVSGELRVAFESVEGQLRLVAPARLPAFEPAWALTIHKSQGSEFDEVLLVVTRDQSALVTRELLYTGITRARRRLALAAPDAVLEACAARPVLRASGLYERLRRPESERS